MQTIFNTADSAQLISRISSLSEQSKPLWGKMDCFQMMRHCAMSDEMFQRKKSYKRLFIGRLFGRMALNGILKNTGSVKKNQPTHPDLKITGTGNVETEKTKWIALLNGYAAFPQDDFMHPFFGKMNTDEIGRFVYKHVDHHLKQFGL